MNMKAIMQQAQKMQKNLLKDQDEINSKIFENENSQVYIKANGKKEILEIKIKEKESLDKEDIEMLEDSIMVVLNGLLEKINKKKKKVMSKYGSGLNGLF